MRNHLREHRISRRWTTFNNAFQTALAIPEIYDEAKAAEAMAILDQQADEDLKCVYCGALAATWDHLYNNVVKGRFSGYGNRIFNLVPSCRTCNERKGGKHWRKFLEESNPPDVDARIALLAKLEMRSNRERFGWEEIKAEFPELAEQYARQLDYLRASLERADETAEQLRDLIRNRQRN